MSASDFILQTCAPGKLGFGVRAVSVYLCMYAIQEWTKAAA